MISARGAELKNVIKNLVPFLCVVPFIVGVIGYYCSGKMVTDSMYASVALYVMSPVGDTYNGFIEFARWTAPLVTATAILSLIEATWKNIVWWFQCLTGDSVAVYSDEDIKVKFKKDTNAIYPGSRLKRRAKSQIFLFSTDQKNFEFYEDNKDKLKNKRCYIGIRELELGLIKQLDGVTLFDINAVVARKLWKKIQLWKCGKQDISIVVYGNSLLAQNILSYGLQTNLFSKKQHVVYHVISDDLQFKRKHPDLPLLNHDELIYHKSDGEDVWDATRAADIVILADYVSAEMLQTFVVNSIGGELYYYSPNVGDAGDYIAFGKINAFGMEEEILSDENIRQQELEQEAMRLNEQYADSFGGEKDWDKLPGFLKNSNISLADFSKVLGELPASMDMETLAELEHIRWCRFHYVNYWKQGPPGNGKRKDEKKRIHEDLVAYSELREEEKEKDRLVVRRSQRDR